MLGGLGGAALGSKRGSVAACMHAAIQGGILALRSIHSSRRRSLSRPWLPPVAGVTGEAAPWLLPASIRPM